jgi:hypothetical protein
MKQEQERIGDWMCMHSGTRFYPADPRPEDINIEDVAWSLAHVNRFCGHTKYPYSIAQHSCMVHDQLPPEHKLAGLLHDISEYVMSDVPRPVKSALPGYKDMEHGIWMAAARKWNLPAQIPTEVKEADNRSLVTERMQIMPEGDDGMWNGVAMYEPYDVEIKPWHPMDARLEFLNRFNDLVR